MWLIKPEKPQSEIKKLISDMNGLLMSIRSLKQESPSKQKRIAENHEEIKSQAKKYINCLADYQKLAKKASEKQEEIPTLDKRLPEYLFGSEKTEHVIVPKQIEEGADLQKVVNKFAEEIINYKSSWY